MLAVKCDAIGLGIDLVMAFDIIADWMSNFAFFTPWCLHRFRLGPGLGRHRIFL
jgi:hypothetical protein